MSNPLNNTIMRQGKKIQFKRRKDGLYIKKLTKNWVGLDDVMNDLFLDDMYLMGSDDGWINIEHANTDSVYHVSDYAYNMIGDLNEKGKALFPLSTMKLSEYEPS